MSFATMCGNVIKLSRKMYCSIVNNNRFETFLMSLIEKNLNPLNTCGASKSKALQMDR